MEKKRLPANCGLMQAAVAVLAFTTLTLSFLVLYLISHEGSTQFTYNFTQFDLPDVERRGCNTTVGQLPIPDGKARAGPSLEPQNVQRVHYGGRKKPPQQQEVVLDPAVKQLVDAIKERTRIANGGVEPVWTEEDSRAWHAQNPCRSRRELLPMYARRNHAKDVDPNPQWEVVLREYSKLHRTCLQRSGHLGHYFGKKNTTTGCQFLITDVQYGTGLGNKVLVVVSNIMYAILTQRVVLVPLPTLLPNIMCEPFEGSSWRIDNSTLPYPPLNHKSKWQFPEYFYRDFDVGKKYKTYASAVTFRAPKIRDQWHPRDRFYCSSEQERYRTIPWLYLTGCLYTLPNLFAIGSFRPTLEALFPDKMALTHLLRTVMLPGDTVWDRVKRINDAYLDHVDKRVGVQVRYKDGLPHYEKMNDLFNERITKCALDNGILPRVNSSVDGRSDDSRTAVPAPPQQKVVVVFITCLYTGLHEHLTRLFLRHPTVTGESVALVQVTHQNSQDFGVEEDRQALSEVMGLSFSDEIFVTPISTYGGLAQAYGALRPWFLEIREKAPQPCTRGRTVDICYQRGSRKYDCPNDEDVHLKRIQDVVPYLTPCLKEDFPIGGVQLITDV